MDPRDHYTTTTAASFTRVDFKLSEGKPVYPYPYGSKPSGYVANFRPAQHYDPAGDTDPVMAPLCTPAEQFTTFNSRVSFVLPTESMSSCIDTCFVLNSTMRRLRSGQCANQSLWIMLRLLQADSSRRCR